MKMIKCERTKIMPLTFTSLGVDYKIDNPYELCELLSGVPILINTSDGKLTSDLRLGKTQIIGMVDIEYPLVVKDDTIMGDIYLTDEKYLSYEYDSYLAPATFVYSERECHFKKVSCLIFKEKKGE